MSDPVSIRCHRAGETLELDCLWENDDAVSIRGLVRHVFRLVLEESFENTEGPPTNYSDGNDGNDDMGDGFKPIT